MPKRKAGDYPGSDRKPVAGDKVSAVTSPQGLTLLHTVDRHLATKQWIWSNSLKEWRKSSYKAGSYFTAETPDLTGIQSLGDFLDPRRRDATAFVIRGGLLPEVAAAVAANPKHRIRRRKLLKNGIHPTIEDVVRSWIMIDVDNFALRECDDLAIDPEAAIEHAVHELLPPEFHDVTAWWQLSSSAGFVPGVLKAHIWFWLTEPASNTHLKNLFEQHAPHADRALFDAVQVHYVADPVVKGRHDPLPRRAGWRKGCEEAVTLPDLLPNFSRPRTTRSDGYNGGGSVSKILRRLGDGEGLDGFHHPLRAAIMQYKRDCTRRGAERDDDALKAMLRHAIEAAPGSVDRGDQYSNTYLQRSIDGAFALKEDQELRSMRPHHAAPTQTLEQAGAAVREQVAGFFERCLAWGALPEEERPEPEQSALIVGLGTGKSVATRTAIPAFIKAAKAAGQPHRVLWLVPFHRLSNEALADMKRLGINAAVWRGRKAEDPDTATPMCRDLEAVEDAESVQANVETSVCGSGKPGELSCPWRQQCAFQQQKSLVAKADVVVAAHQMLFRNLPKEMSKGIGAVIIDESWWQAGLAAHRELNLDGYSLEPFRHPVMVQNADKRYVPDNGDTIILHDIAARVDRGLRVAADGKTEVKDGELVSKAAVQAAGLTPDHCDTAIKLEWRRRRDGLITPGQTREQRREALKTAAGNVVIPKRVALLRALKELLESNNEHTGRLQISQKDTVDGSFKTVLIHSRLELGDGIAKLPLLLLDATMPIDIVRQFLPRIEVRAEVHPKAPHMHVTQIIGGWGKSSIVPHEKAAPEENRRRERLIASVSDFVALNSGNDALVVTYEAIEDKFRRDGVRTGHFNAIAGLDQYKDVRALFVIGRPLPDPRSLREQALALTGEPIPEENGHTEQRGVLRTDGSGTAIDVRCFEHPTLEALKTAITDAEIEQAVGRGRGVWRSTEKPLDIFLFADVATALPVARLEQWPEIRPDVVERMAARGLVLLGATDAARIYDDLFPTPDAARMALSRTSAADFPNKPLGVRVFLGECSGNRLVPVTYHPTGRGQQTRRAWVAESRLDSLAAWLTEQLGSPVQVTPVTPSAAAAPHTPQAAPVPLRPDRSQTAVQTYAQSVVTYQHPPTPPWRADELVAQH